MTNYAKKLALGIQWWNDLLLVEFGSLTLQRLFLDKISNLMSNGSTDIKEMAHSGHNHNILAL